MRAESIACRVWIATPVMGSRVRKSTWTTAPSAENSLNERRINSGIIFTVTRIVRFRVEDKTPAFESNYGLRFRVNRSLSLLWSVACALRKRAHTITHSLLKTFWWRHCIGSTWSRQTTGVPERVLSSGHNSGVSSTFRKNVEESASNRHPSSPPFPLEIARNRFFVIQRPRCFRCIFYRSKKRTENQIKMV